MSVKSSAHNYGLIARLLHWSVAVLIITMVAMGYLIGELPKPNAIVVIHIHKATGILTLVLASARLAWWAADAVRPGDAELTWEKWPSRLVKWGLAAFSVIMPVTGWLMSSAADKPISFFDLFQVPLLIAPDKELAHLFKETHDTLGLIIAVVIAVHVAGALRHHFILKDRVLARMLGR